MWRVIRIFVLLFVLVVVATQALIDRNRSRDWENTLWVGLHPLNADGSEVAERFLADIQSQRYTGLEEFFAREGSRYGLANDRLIRLSLYPRPARLPPPLAREPGRFDVLVWSLRMRWYAWRAPDGPVNRPPPCGCSCCSTTRRYRRACRIPRGSAPG